MVKADMLYQLNIRLQQDLKQLTDTFGGISVLLSGDLMQLRPIQANWIFDMPINPKYHDSATMQPLWDEFKFVELKHNHRQGDDKSYAELLNRVRFGKHTDEDIALLNTRVTPSLPEDALHIFGKNKGATEMNNAKLERLRGEVVKSTAINFHPQQTNFVQQVWSAFRDYTPLCFPSMRHL